MIAHLGQLVPFVSADWKSGWRQYRRALGGLGSFCSPIFFVLFYVALHLFFALLHATEPTTPRALQNIQDLQGLFLLASYVVMVAAAIFPVSEMVLHTRRWDLILSAPISLKLVVSLKLIVIAMRSMVIPLLLITPAINLKICAGDVSLLLFYPAMLGLGLFATATAAFMIAALRSWLRMRRVKVALAFLGLGLLASIIAFCLMQARSVLSVLGHPELILVGARSHIDWLGGALFGNGLALLVVIFIGIFSLIAMVDQLAALLQRQTGLAMERHGLATNVSTYGFTDSLQQAVLRKEWRLIRRDWRFFLDMARQVIALATIFLVILNVAKSYSLMTVGVLSVTLCALVANDMSWRMVSVDQVRDLIVSCPLPKNALARRRVVAASIVPLAMLLPICFVMDFFSPVVAIGTFVFGAGCTIGALLLNFRIRPLRGNLDGKRLKQDAGTILCQASNIFIWSVVFYLSATEQVALAIVTILAGVALVGLRLLQSR
jgi:hypothetical protein